MKFAVFCFVLFAVILFASANQGANQDQFMTESELSELITDYQDLYKKTKESESGKFIDMAQKTKDLTVKYFKTVGIEIAKHMCGQLDNILRAYNLHHHVDEASINSV